MYTVYMHITPNGKKYVGITHKKPKYRWGCDGVGYDTQLFGKAVNKYGWDNIEHIIIATNLSYEWACQLEKILIRDYKLQDPEFGYNIYCGGECGNVGLHLSEEHKQKIRNANLGKQLSNETRNKLSVSHIGKKCGPMCEETKRKISESNKGKHFKYDRNIYADPKHFWMNNGAEEIRVTPSQVAMYRIMGYSIGKILFDC